METRLGFPRTQPKEFLMKFACAISLLMACSLVVNAGDDDLTPMGPAAGNYLIKLHDPNTTNVLVNREVLIELPGELRITRYKRLRSIVHSEGVEISGLKDSKARKYQEALANQSGLDEEFFSGTLSSGPLWLSKINSPAETGVLTADLHISHIKCEKRFCNLAFWVSVRDGDRHLLRYRGLVLFNLGEIGPRSSLVYCVRYAGDWLGQIFRSIWKGERETASGNPPKPMAASAPSSAPTPPGSAPAPAPSSAVASPEPASDPKTTRP